MLLKRLGYRWAMLFQSTSSSRKPWSRSNRHVALPSHKAAGYESTWGTLLTSLTSPVEGPCSLSETSLKSIRVSAVTTCARGAETSGQGPGKRGALL